MRIFGIDPGSIFCGWSVVDYKINKFKLVDSGVIKAKVENDDFNIRLKFIYDRLTSLIKENQPDIAVLETQFYAKNPQSLMKLTQARTVALMAAMNCNLQIFEYSPNEVKKSVTGRGHASKEQVQYIIKSLLATDAIPEKFDESDAISIAICHGLRSNTLKSKSSSWSDYIKKNPSKVL